MGVAEFVLMVATGSAAILLLNRVRSRTKLIYVGLGAGLVAILTTIGVGTLIGEPLGSWSGTGLLADDGGRTPARRSWSTCWPGPCGTDSVPCWPP